MLPHHFFVRGVPITERNKRLHCFRQSSMAYEKEQTVHFSHHFEDRRNGSHVYCAKLRNRVSVTYCLRNDLVFGPKIL